MPDIKTAFEKAFAQTKAHVEQPIPTEWDDETPNATITEVNTMQADATNTGRTYFKTTNNVTRETFDFVRNNPGYSRTTAAEMLAAKGFKKASTSSLLGQMIKQGLLREKDGGVFANQTEYTPLKTSKRKQAAPAKEAPAKRQYVKRNAAAKAAAYEAHENYNPYAFDAVRNTARVASTNTLLAEEFDAQKFVDGMTFKQAKAVYDVLSKVFKS